MSASDSSPASVPTGIEAIVCQDIATRQQFGLGKYQISVADNPLPLREWLHHAYLESLDKSIYLRRAIAEIDATSSLHTSHSALGTSSTDH